MPWPHTPTWDVGGRKCHGIQWLGRLLRANDLKVLTSRPGTRGSTEYPPIHPPSHQPSAVSRQPPIEQTDLELPLQARPHPSSGEMGMSQPDRPCPTEVTLGVRRQQTMIRSIRSLLRSTADGEDSCSLPPGQRLHSCPLSPEGTVSRPDGLMPVHGKAWLSAGAQDCTGRQHPGGQLNSTGTTWPHLWEDSDDIHSQVLLQHSCS